MSKYIGVGLIVMIVLHSLNTLPTSFFHIRLSPAAKQVLYVLRYMCRHGMFQLRRSSLDTAIYVHSGYLYDVSWSCKGGPR